MKKFLIVGLGNPGEKFANQRHNIGFMVIDAISQEYGLSFSNHKHQSMIAQFRLNTNKIILLKPQTFMNLSGNAVNAIMKYYDIPKSNTLIVFDDLDLPLGTIRLRKSGSASGHNGMNSIITILKSKLIPRLRIGLGRPPKNIPPKNYVLQSFSRDEKRIIDELLPKTIALIETMILQGIDIAMNKYNTRKQ